MSRLAAITGLRRWTAAEAVDRAAMIVERFDRTIARAVRLLRDLRKQTVVIENHGQVNVAQVQQVHSAGNALG